MLSRTAKRLTQALFSSAIVFLLLGIGNMIFASSKLSNYRDLLQKARQEPVSMEAERKQDSLAALKQPSRFLPGPNNDKQAQHINRLSMRIHYYELVMAGAKIFLAASALLVLLGFYVRRGFLSSVFS